MRQFQVTGVAYVESECPCLGGHCDDDCDCDCDCAEYPSYHRCDCGRNDPDDKPCDVLVTLDVPFGAGWAWIQTHAEDAALHELWLLDADNRDWWFGPFDAPDVAEVGQEPVDVFLVRVGALPLPGFEALV